MRSGIEIDLYDATVEQLETLVIDWAEERNIVPDTSIEGCMGRMYSSDEDIKKFQQAQFVKLQEEVNELKEAIDTDNNEEFIDAIGDIMVCLTMQANIIDEGLTQCFAHAYAQIKDRKGKMVDGVFVKEEG